MTDHARSCHCPHTHTPTPPPADPPPGCPGKQSAMNLAASQDQALQKLTLQVVTTANRIVAVEMQLKDAVAQIRADRRNCAAPPGREPDETGALAYRCRTR
jgi:hypothetical protein